MTKSSLIILIKFINIKTNKTMKLIFHLKDKFPSIEFCYNNKVVIIRYWGGLKFDKVVIYGVSNNKNK
jgi:hypothetical protein